MGSRAPYWKIRVPDLLTRPPVTETDDGATARETVASYPIESDVWGDKLFCAILNPSEIGSLTDCEVSRGRSKRKEQPRRAGTIGFDHAYSGSQSQI